MTGRASDAGALRRAEAKPDARRGRRSGSGSCSTTGFSDYPVARRGVAEKSMAGRAGKSIPLFPVHSSLSRPALSPLRGRPDAWVVGLEGAAPVLEGDAGGDLVGEARPAVGRVLEGLGRGGPAPPWRARRSPRGRARRRRRRRGVRCSSRPDGSGLTPGITGEPSTSLIKGPLVASPVHSPC